MRLSILLSMLALSSATAAPAESAPHRVDLDERTIRVADIARPDSGLSGSLGDRAVATIPEGVDTVSLSEARRRELLRRHFPLAAADLRHDGEVVFHAPRARERVNSPTCLALREPVAAGEYIGREDVEPTSCDAASAAAPVRYDRDVRALRAAADLEPGAYLGALDVRSPGPLAAGTTLTLVSRSGPVELTRDARLLQAGRPGDSAFVRTPDGDVFAVPLIDGERSE